MLDGSIYRGAEAEISVHSLSLQDNQYSKSQIWLENGPSGQLNSIQAGWAVSKLIIFIFHKIIIINMFLGEFIFSKFPYISNYICLLFRCIQDCMVTVSHGLQYIGL